jgi:hypothetical protein
MGSAAARDCEAVSHPRVVRRAGSPCEHWDQKQPRARRETVMSFWQVVWEIVIVFAFVAYLMVLFSIIGDLFRDNAMSGWVKALWIIALIVVPFLSAFIYIVSRGQGMTERHMEEIAARRQQTDAYIRDVAASTTSATTPTDQIAKAQKMLDDGVISQPEYDRLKAKALA